MSSNSGGSSLSIAGTDARDGTDDAELRERTKAGEVEGFGRFSKRKPFNEERQFGEAKLPVLKWSENP